MSDSELSTPANIPADAELEQCLRRTVRVALKAGEEITINLARSRVEEELGLDGGFFKGNSAWKTRSKDIISAAVEEPESLEKSKKTAPKAKAGAKRKSDEAQPKQKRRKKAATPESEEDEAVIESEADHESPLPKAKKRQIKQAAEEGDDDEAKDDAATAQQPDVDDSALSEPPEVFDEPKTNGKPGADADDESELSSVIDEPAPKKKRQKKSTSPSETKSKSKKAAKPTKELSADEEEIKRLQGWLVKCGVRKVWGKELKKFDTPKQKIKHLKSLLEEVGMTGRYSAEKAKQIKESRELAAELEAAKEFNDQWGQEKDGGADEDEELEEKVKPKRLRPKGLIDFGDSGDED
jgi:hypothetical protein